MSALSPTTYVIILLSLTILILTGWILYLAVGRRRLFVTYDRRTGHFKPYKILGSPRYFRLKTEDGQRLSWPLMDEMGHPWGKDGRGAVFFGDLTTQKPVRVTRTKSHQSGASVQDGSWVPVSNAKIWEAPSASRITAILEDDREIKMIKASRGSDKPQAAPNMLIMLLVAAAAAWFFLSRNGAA